jgi:pimeloyl-ACP methyl ester carboxylesterase
MLRRGKRVLIGLSGLLIIAVLTGATYEWIATDNDLSATPPPGRLVDVGGHRLHIWCSGAGAPSVILETGLGGSSAGWGFVQPAVAQFTRVCSYDRAGLGYSDPGPSPRTARRMARELAQLLDHSGIEGPVVLVGASIGGFVVRMFASEYAERAAGLVLVDATHEDQQDQIPQLASFVPILSSVGVLRLLGVSFAQSPASLAPPVRKFAEATAFRAAGARAAADEIIHIRESAAEVRATRRKLTIPLIAVMAGRGANEGWRALQYDQARLSDRGCLVTAEQSGHVIAINQPQVVVDAIRAVVDAARSPSEVPLCGSRLRNME